MSESDEEPDWFYEDKEGQTNGPFPESQLVSWLVSGVFDQHLKVKRDPDEKGVRLSVLRPPFFLQAQKEIQHGGVVFTGPRPSGGKAAPDPTPQPIAWFYIDTTGQQHGPYDSVTMASWQRASYFPPNTMVRSTREKEFVPLYTRPEAFVTTAAAERRAKQREILQNQANGGGEGEEQSTKRQKTDADTPVHTAVAHTDAHTDAGASHHAHESGSHPGQHDTATPADGTAQAETTGASTPAAPNAVSQPVEGGEGEKGDGDEAGSDSGANGSTAAQGDADSKWFYMDQSGKEQGPWTTQQMQQWFVHGMLPADVCVRLESETQHIALADQPRVFSSGPTAPTPKSAAVLPQSTQQPSPAAAQPAPTQHSHAPQPPGPPPPMPPMAMMAGMAMGMGGGMGLGGMGLGMGGMGVGMAPPPGPPPPFFRGNMPPRPLVVGPPSTLPSEERALKDFFGEAGASGPSYWDQKGIPRDKAGRQMAHFFDVDRWQEEKNREAARKEKKALKAVKKKKKL